MIERHLSDGRDDWLVVLRIYPSRRSYLAACRRLRPDPESPHRNGWATTFNESRVGIAPDGSETYHTACFVYLDATMLDADVASHEAFHAAMQLYRLRHRGSGNFARAVGDAEEEAAYSAGRIAQGIADAAWDGGIWGAEPTRE